MPLHNVPLQQSLEAARQKIVDLFIEQCANGAQTAALGDSKVAACGQFIGEDAWQLQQRGLHGTAAALRVLSKTDNPRPDASDLCRRLVKYVQDRDSIESQAKGEGSQEYLEIDAQNVIKQSELLYALSYTTEEIPNVKKLKRQLITQLQSGLIQQKGWTYFLDDKTSPRPELLPTAYAVFALSSVGKDVSQPAAYLFNELEQTGSQKQGIAEVGADISIRVACLYVLTFRNGGNSHDSYTDKKLRDLFAPMWSDLERLLRGENIEQNVEYWRGAQTFYVRVPWQLYLLALAARLRFYERFSAYAATTRLSSLLSQIEEEKFRYPHSGDKASSRTNAIAYEVLGRIRSELQRHIMVIPIYWFDRARGSTWLRRILVFAAFGLILWSIGSWLRGGADVAELATEFVGPAILALLALWSKKR